MRAIALIAVLAAAAGCGGGNKALPWAYEPQPMADTLPIYEPEERTVPLAYDFVHQTIVNPIGGYGGGRALNLSAMDEVVNSTWWTDRDVSALSPEQIRRGPQTSDGPAPPLTVWSIKTTGVTPGFNVEDADGVRWAIKFDPPEYEELASGAEVIATNLFWASGYNTPENYIYYLDPSDLVLDGDLEVGFYIDEDLEEYRVGDPDPEHELTMEFFSEQILDRYPRRSDGTIRTVASKFIPGIPKGFFSYRGTRDDDPNDVVPHQHRRELRGLYVVEAWLNQTDTKQGNTFDTFILASGSPREGGGRFGYLRHYLIDFGSSLGSGAVQPHTPRHGSEHELDVGAIGKRFLSIGGYRRPWQSIDETAPLPSTGYYSVDNFDPGDWRPHFPNSAFENVDSGDGYWGAKIVMSFTDAQLAAAVEAGGYSDPAATRYILEGLKARRDATGRYWFTQASPLDNPRVESGAITFDDRYVQHFGGAAQYSYKLHWDAPDPDLRADGTVTEARIPLPVPEVTVPAEADPKDAYAQLRVWKVHADGKRAASPATFWLAWNPAERAYRVVGIRY